MFKDLRLFFRILFNKETEKESIERTRDCCSNETRMVLGGIHYLSISRNWMFCEKVANQYLDNGYSLYAIHPEKIVLVRDK